MRSRASRPRGRGRAGGSSGGGGGVGDLFFGGFLMVFFFFFGGGGWVGFFFFFLEFCYVLDVAFGVFFFECLCGFWSSSLRFL